MKKHYKIGIGLILGIGITLGFGFYWNLPKTGFVQTQQVFAGFGQTKELENKLNQIRSRQRQHLDSLQILLREEWGRLNTKDASQVQRFEKMQEEYLRAEAYMDQESNRLSKAYDEQIWKQLNQYIQEYGEKKNYQYIYGASGEGNLMYARSSEDITEEVLQFVNQRYEGDL